MGIVEARGGPSSGRVLLAVCTFGLGLDAGGLVLGVMNSLQKLLPVPVATYFFAAVGLSSVAAGLTAGWFGRWRAVERGRLYAWITSSVWFVLLTSAGLHVSGWGIAVSAWPLIFLGVLALVLGGMLNQRM